MTILFLDIDGVLNDHDRMPNGFCGTDREMIRRMNRVLDTFPELKIVVSSAWRYVVHNGISTVLGLEHLLLTHGLKCHGRVLGVTAEDPEKFDPVHHAAPFDVEYWKARGLKWRGEQILAYVQAVKPDAWVAVDDLPIVVHPSRMCQTDGETGLTDADADWIIESLTEQLEIAKSRRANA